MLEHDLGDRAGEKVPCFGTRLDLRLAMLQNPLRTGPTDELVWYVAEANALRRIRRDVSAADRARLIAETRRWVIRDLRGFDETSRHGSSEPEGDRRIPDSLAELLFRFGKSKMEYWSDEDWEGLTLQALWRVCCDGVRDIPAFTTPAPLAIRHRDVLLEATGVDTDLLVDDRLIPFSAAFLDQGFAHWELPRRDEGFYRAFCSLYRLPWGPPDRWMGGLAEEAGRLLDEGIGPLESVLESLRILGVAKEEWERYLSATFLVLRGWAGMVRQIEARGDRVVRPVPQGSLVEFLAIRLLLDRFAVAYTARTSLGIKTPVREFWRLARGWVDPQWPHSVEQRAFPVFQLAQISGLSPDVLYRLNKQEWRTILQEVDSFSGLESPAGLPPGLRAALLHADRGRCGSPCPSPGPDSKPAEVSGDLLPRRARRVDAPPHRGTGSGRGDVQHGRLLLGRDVLSRGGRCAFRTPLPGRDPSWALGRRAGDRQR